MKILVTGGAGFLGSHLCDRLIKDDHSVICIDNFLTGNKQNIEHLLDNKHFTFIEHDVLKPITDEILKEIQEDKVIDQIYNLACPASPIHYQNDPINTLKVNFIGMLHVLELAKEKGARVLQASTSEIYGDPDVHPQTENYHGNVNTLGLRACYDEGKRVAETLCMDFYRQEKVDIRLVRIFNTYGPKMDKDDGRVVSNFINQALNGEDITIYGEGSQTRSLLYVDDQIEGLIRMMNQDEFIGPVNIGSEDEKEIKEIAEIIVKLVGSESRLIYKDLPQDDPKQRRPDISLVKEKLNWQPTVDLEDGLQRTIAYFKR